MENCKQFNCQGYEEHEGGGYNKFLEDDFNYYIEKLQLKDDDLSNKKILDVGSGSAWFAKYAKDNGISSSVYSLEPVHSLTESSRGVRAVAEKMPFADKSFDLIVSMYAIPIMHRPGYEEFQSNNFEAVFKNVFDSFSEMLRVLNNGGEIRIVPIMIYNDISEDNLRNSGKILNEAIDTALLKLSEKYEIETERIRMPSEDLYRYDDQGTETKDLLGRAYKLIIKKIAID